MPYLQDGGKLCLKFYDLDWSNNNTLSGCVDLIGYLFDVKVGKVKIGCFHLGYPMRYFKSHFRYHVNEVMIVNSNSTSNNDTIVIKHENTIKLPSLRFPSLFFNLNSNKTDNKIIVPDERYRLRRPTLEFSTRIDSLMSVLLKDMLQSFYTNRTNNLNKIKTK